MPPETWGCSPMATWLLVLFGGTVGVFVGMALEPTIRRLRIQRFFSRDTLYLRQFREKHRDRARDRSRGFDP